MHNACADHVFGFSLDDKFGYARENSVQQNNNTPVYPGQRAGRLLIAPLIEEHRDLIDPIRMKTGFTRHFAWASSLISSLFMRRVSSS
jgi:hypothetical protein